MLWLLSVGVIVSFLACAAVRWTRWLTILFVPITAFMLIGLTSEIRDPYVGPAIIREAGYVYVASGWIAGLLPVIGCVVGWTMRRRKQKNA